MNWLPVVTVRLPYPISANAYWRTRMITPRGKAAIVSTYVTHEARAYKERVGWMVKAAGMIRPISDRVRIDVQLHPHCPQDWRTRERKDPLWWADSVQRLDLDNVNKVLLDALKGVAIVDDAQVWELTGKVMEPQPDVQACVVVRISRGEKVQPQQPQQALELREEEVFP